MFAGKFIVIDGPDGCGKSTQVELISSRLMKQGAVVESYRDPGTTPVGENIRSILLDTANYGMSVNTELLLYMAARAQLWHERIRSALEGGKCVVMDRWVSSTCAYQGYAGGLGVEKVISLAEQCLERVWPDVTIIIDVDVETASLRMNRQLDRMEQKGQAFHRKVRQGYVEFAGMYPDVVVVDGREGIEQVHLEITAIIEKMMRDDISNIKD